jgi:hypothetical protein
MATSESIALRTSAVGRTTKRPTRRVLTAACVALLGFGLLASCNTTDSSGGDAGGSSGGSSGASGSSGGSGSGSGGSSGGRSGSGSGNSGGSSGSADGGASGGSSGGSGSSGGNGSSGGSGSSGASSGGADGGGSSSGVADAGYVCSNTDFNILPIDNTGFIGRACNVYGVQGAWYCFSDSATGEGCTKGVVPYSAASPGPGMCLQGTLPAGTGNYVGIGMELNATGGTNAVKMPFNATAGGIVGFEITITGNTGGDAVRVGFTNDNGTTMNYVAPFAPEPPGAGVLDVLFSQVPPVPNYPNIADQGAVLDPTKIYDVQVELPGQAASVNYNFCVTSIKPLFSVDAGVPGTCSSMVAIGSPNCTNQDIVRGVDYGIQNNMFGSNAGQCTQAMQGGTCAGFATTFTNGSFGNGGNVPSSYPSVIYGWQNGTYFGTYQASNAKMLSKINSANTSWQYSVPGGTYDAAYDTWLGPSTTATPGLELMVWLGYGGGIQPAGSQVKTAISIPNVSGTWDVWKGTVGSWQYLAYRTTAPSGSANVSFDLNKFFQDALNNQSVGLSASSYLMGIQAGFEIYSESGTLTTNSFSVSVQ